VGTQACLTGQQTNFQAQDPGHQPIDHLVYSVNSCELQAASCKLQAN
jgi:hypothetical protein